jgi:hypothetical protein
VARAWSAVLRYVVGYGYRPWLAVGWAALILALGTAGVAYLDDDSPRNFQSPANAPDFQPLLYTADTMLPFVDFGFSKWTAHGGAQVAASLLVVLGWIVATMLVVAFTSVLRRGE